MPIRNLAEIFIPEGRARREFPPGAHDDLIASILAVGNLHPPVVRQDGALLAGERRFRAIQEIAERGESYHAGGKFLHPGLIMTTDIRELGAVGNLQAEIEENTIREDLSWQDKAAATATLEELRRQLATSLAEERGIDPVTAAQLAEATVTPKTLAAEIRGVAEPTAAAVNDVKADLWVDVWLRNHPDDKEVGGAKTRSEALKIIEQKLEDERRGALARRFRLTRETEGHVLLEGSVLQIWPDTPPDVYDCIVCDPPWGVGADGWANQSSTRTHAYTDDPTTAAAIYQCLATQGFRVCKPKAHAYIFCSFPHFTAVRNLLVAAGWNVWPTPLIWHRGSSGIAPKPEHGPRQTYELIIFANKGDKRVIRPARSDVLIYPKPADDPRAAAKPVGLYYELLSRSCVPGDEVIDPCCGSGAIFPAATALEVRATGLDIDPEAIGLSSERLKEGYVPVEAEITFRKTKRQGGVRTKV